MNMQNEVDAKLVQLKECKKKVKTKVRLQKFK